MKNEKINCEDFVELNDKYIIYILGFLWGDGYISNLKNKHKNYNVGLEISSKDFKDISNIFLKIGNWNIYHRKRYLKKTNKYYEMSSITICNKKLL